MNSHKLVAALMWLLLLAICVSALLVVCIFAGVGKAVQEVLAVLNISLIVTPLLFSGFLLKDIKVNVGDLYKDFRSGFIAVAVFGLSGSLAGVFWQDWLALLQKFAA